MRDQLPEKSNHAATGIINLDGRISTCTHWVAYVVDPRGVVYFDSYGLAQPEEFSRYISGTGAPIWYSTLPKQTLTDPPICGPEIFAVLNAVSRSSVPPHKVGHEYSSKRHRFKQV